VLQVAAVSYRSSTLHLISGHVGPDVILVVGHCIGPVDGLLLPLFALIADILVDAVPGIDGVPWLQPPADVGPVARDDGAHVLEQLLLYCQVFG
jgi:hypothetical protein